MADIVGEVFGNRPRRRRALSEKLRIVELTLEPGASVAQIARENGVNGYQTTQDYVLGPSGEQVTEMGMHSNGTMAWAHTNVWAAGKLLATYD